MCHNDDSRPPAAPEHGALGHHGDLVLTADDGNRFDAYEAHPVHPSHRGMVILPDIRGLHSYYKDLADRFAEVGFHAVAFDYFARTAGRGDRSEGFDFMAHVPQTSSEGVNADARASAKHLRDAGATSLFTVGFCFGGTHSWRQAAAMDGVKGCIGFYGRPDGILAVQDEVEAPLLMLLGGADQSIDPAAFDPMIRKLTDRGIATERKVYEGAPHSFFDRSFAQHAEACADAWARILHFTQRFA